MMHAIAVRLGLVLSLVASLSSCGPKGGSKHPDSGGGAGGAGKGDGVALRYAAAPLQLEQTGQFDSTARARGEYNSIAAKYTVGLALTPAGDKVKVVWSFADIGTLDLQGSLAPKPGAADPKAEMLRLGKGAYLVDLRGEVDEDASRALPENEARRKQVDALSKQAEEAEKAGKPFEAPGLALMQTARAMVSLPVLPEQGLTVGKPVVITEEEELQLAEGGPKMPTETETKYTLVKIDSSGAKRIAEVQFETVTSGALETQMGLLSLESTTEGTMLFDLDGHAPLSFHATTNQTFASGSEQVFENTIVVNSTFEAA
ncbi:MAG TPA: hypothetical protein VFG69_03510 [Nannocystaceae bacterium]|nr:hypothetical protein [Nannocystaceae bacterium]